MNLINYNKVLLVEMSDEKDYLRSYTLFEKLENEKAKEALLEIMRAKAEQIRRYADSVIRLLQQSGVILSISTKTEWSTTGLDVYIHFDIVSVRNDKIPELERRTLKFQKMKDIDDDDLRNLTSIDDI